MPDPSQRDPLPRDPLPRDSLARDLFAREAREPTPRLSISDEKDIRVVEFNDQKILDEANIVEIFQALLGLIEGRTRPKLLLDFANVEHLSSAALGKLIDVNNRIREQSGQFRLANIKSQIYDVFVITKLNKLFRILPTREEALQSFTT